MALDTNRTGRYRLGFPDLVKGVDTYSYAVLDSFALGIEAERIHATTQLRVELQAEELINHMEDTGWKTIKVWG